MFLTVKQAAAFACVSQSLIYALLKSGRLDAVRIGCRVGKGKWLVKQEALTAFLETCKPAIQQAPALRHIH
jgi:excisionase family DNA binding protein